MYRKIRLFTKNHIKQLQRKWYSLPLLFILPIVVIAMFALMMTLLFSSDKQSMIRVGLVDLDESREAQMVMNVLENSKEFSHFISVEQMSFNQAKEKIHQNEISTYIIFPENFSSLLYTGQAVDLQIIGNQNQRIESHFVQSFMISIAEHINSAQASILTIGNHIQQLEYSEVERREMILDQFQSFLLFVLIKDDVIDEVTIVNETSESPKTYYIVSSLFMTITAWTFLAYYMLQTDSSLRVERRMRLYQVTVLQQIISKFITCFMLVLPIALIGFIGTSHLLQVTITTQELFSVFGRLTLFFTTMFSLFVILELLIRSKRISLFAQLALLSLFVVLSGAIVPTIYFPAMIENFAKQSFSFYFFQNLNELLLKQTFLSSLHVSLTICILTVLLMVLLSIWKERHHS